jgi:molybdopterin molybdotransferase
VQALTIEQARAAVLAAVCPLPAERVPVEAALGRVLAEDVAANGDTPPFDASAMDGYAIQAGPPGRRLRVTGEARAGAPASTPLAPGHAVRISTGAMIPAGATAVIRQEDVRLDGDTIETAVEVEAGRDIRHAGEDMRAGALVLRAGCRLGPVELAAAVAAGAGEVLVAARPAVAVLCTGDELRDPGEPLAPGEIHNSNGVLLQALAAHAGAEAARALRVSDDAQATQAAIAEALGVADVLLLSGGVSVGPHDHVKPALDRLGVEQRFWRVALRPGGPVWFGTYGRRLVFALPGNPVSTAVTFALFARPALLALQSVRLPQDGERKDGEVRTARLAVAVPGLSGREQAVRVRLRRTEAGLEAEPTGPQGSHIVTSLLGADALAIIPRSQGAVPAGTEVRLERAPG